MNTLAKLIKPDGTVTAVKPNNGATFDYDELTLMVGGYIQVIVPQSKTGAVMVCNEEGKLLGMPLNPLATMMWQEGAEPGSMRMADPVVGPVLLCPREMIE